MRYIVTKKRDINRHTSNDTFFATFLVTSLQRLGLIELINQANRFFTSMDLKLNIR
jgi:hypothetical protein